MSRAHLITGDVFDRLALIPDGSIDCIVTSPPFLALRSYLPADHPDKAKEIGSERTPAEFIDTLLALSAEWRRVLAPHGSMWVELGDTYAGSGGVRRDDHRRRTSRERNYNAAGLRDGQAKFNGSASAGRGLAAAGGRADRAADVAAGLKPPQSRPSASQRDCITGWPLDKCLAMIPQSYAFALAYGINPHTGQPSPAGRWRVRNVIRWVRPNPPVGALGDKVRPATSEMVSACVSKTRWFDLDAVRTPASANTHARVAQGAEPRHDLPSQQRDGNWSTLACQNSDPAAGAPPLDWWQISPGGYEGAHYAVFPAELCRIPILTTCPLEVCTACGTPRRRITETTYRPHSPQTIERQHAMPRGQAASGTRVLGVDASFTHGRADKIAETLGWTDCGCGAPWRRGRVLDPFAGSGTTLMAATGHGRDAIGIDIDNRNADLARDRCGMFLDVSSGIPEWLK